MKVMLLMALFAPVVASQRSTTIDELTIGEIRRERNVTIHMLQERLRVTDRQLQHLHNCMKINPCPLIVVEEAENVNNDMQYLKRALQKMGEHR